MAGVSLQPAFKDEALDRKTPIYWEHEGNRALRDGEWKIVAKGPGGAWELYDMKVDRTESHDLASQQPERIKDMTTRWETWAKNNEVLPWIWKPAYGKTAGKSANAPEKKSE
jgi:arylsulfatase